MASLILGTIGSTLFGPIGGFIGSMIGSLIDAYLFTPAPPDVEGPRIGDTSTSRADPGVPIPLVLGADRVGVVIIGTTPLIETRQDEKIKSGKKSYISTTYTYAQTVDLLLSEGPILGIGRMWADGKPLRALRGDFTLDAQTNQFNVGLYPYPAWYRFVDRMYDPALCPWSLNPANSANPSSTRWVLDAVGELFVADASAQAAAMDRGDLIYWQDLDTNYFHPLGGMVAYQNIGTVTDQFGNVYYGNSLAESEATVIGPSSTSPSMTDILVFAAAGGAFTTQYARDWDATGWPPESNQRVTVGDSVINPNITTGASLWYTGTGSLIGNPTTVLSGSSSFGCTQGSNSLYNEVGFVSDMELYPTAITTMFPEYIDHLNSGNTTYAVQLRFTLFDAVTDDMATVDWKFTAIGSPAGDVVIYEETQTVTAPSSGNHGFYRNVTTGVPPFTTHIRREATIRGISSSSGLNPSAQIFNYVIPYRTGAVAQGGGKYRGWDDYYNLHAALNDFSPLGVLAYQSSYGLSFYRGTDDQIADPTMTAVHGKPIPGYHNRAHLVLNNLQLEDFGNRLPSITVEVVRYENERIPTVINNLMTRAGLPAKYYDTKALPTFGLDSYLPGYTISRRTTIRKVIEDLMEAFRVDAAEIGPKLVFRSRTRSADHIIDLDELAAREAGSPAEETLRIQTRDTYEMPRVIEASFIDIERDYQNNSLREQRAQTINDHTASVALSMVLYPFFVKAWTRTKLQDVWLRKTVEFTLPPRYIYVSPSDIITVISDIVIGTEVIMATTVNVVASMNIKITQVRRGSNGLLECRGVLSNGAQFPHDDYDDIVTSNEYTVYTNWKQGGFSELVFLDLPPLTESDVTFGWYYAMSDTNNPQWQGADLLQSVDGGNNYDVIGGTTVAAVLGIVTTGVLAAVTGNYVETTSNIIVTLTTVQATFASVTVDQMLNSRANMALIGKEIVCFTDVTYLGNRQYRLNGAWTRGLLATENQLSSHVANEPFVLLTPGVIQNYDAAIGDIGNTFDYKPVTNAVSEAITPSEQFTHTGRRYKPFSPVQVTATRDGSNNMTITWVRRDKLAYSWTNNVDLAISEATLEYTVEILSPSAIVLRTIDVTTETASYTAAEQTADGLTPGNNVNIRIYQISNTVGRGMPAIGVV